MFGKLLQRLRRSGSAATVLVPTHDHTACLEYSLGSVLRQTVQDFELFIVGDGVPQRSRDFIRALADRDNRVRFFDFEKGPHKGEAYRHEALKQANGRIVAYLGDDDLWMPDHLATLVELFEDADFGHTLHVGIDAEGRMFFVATDLEDRVLRRRMLTEPGNCFDFTFGGHRLAAYRRLPGWSPAPPGVFGSDFAMWRQFLGKRWCRAKTAKTATAICTQTHLRPAMTDEERAAELGRLTEAMGTAEAGAALRAKIAESLAREPRPPGGISVRLL